MSVNIQTMKEQEDKRHGALSATVAITQMDPNAREDLICYMKALNEAQQSGDAEEKEYLAKAILEVFEIDCSNEPADIGSWEEEVIRPADGKDAAIRLKKETDRFFSAYQRHKEQSGLTTVRAIAEASGLSPTTVNAIEKQRVKPQYKTMAALARAFKTSVESLSNP